MSLKLAPGEYTILIVALAMLVLGVPAEATLSNPPIQQKVDAPGRLVDRNALRIPMNTRAVTVRPEPASTATGYVVAGARVDVLVLARHDGKGSAKTILRSLMVLAVNRAESAGSARALVTLAVPAARVERLVRAEAQGEIRLAASPIAASPPNAREMHSVKVPTKTKAAG